MTQQMNPFFMTQQMNHQSIFDDIHIMNLLNVVLDKKKRRLICWAISIVKHLESLYR